MSLFASNQIDFSTAMRLKEVEVNVMRQSDHNLSIHPLFGYRHFANDIHLASRRCILPKSPGNAKEQRE
jgi:prephenate dehydrogenase